MAVGEDVAATGSNDTSARQKATNQAHSHGAAWPHASTPSWPEIGPKCPGIAGHAGYSRA